MQFSTLLRKAGFVHLAFVALAASQFVQAQAPSSSANGNSNVQATVPAGKILLSGVSDIPFPTWDGSTGQTETLSGICVWSTIRQYSLTITSDTGSFELTSANTTDTIPFSVNWKDHSAIATPRTVAHNTKLSSLEAPSTTKDCSDASTQASMIVALTEADLAAAIAETYTAGLTVEVIAE